MKVTYVDHMGSDLSVVNAARVSFGKTSNYVIECQYCDGDYLNKCWEFDAECEGHRDKWVLKESDKKLINYLAKHEHFSPFNHTFITMHVKAPVFVARQLVKHEYMPWNEISRRYVDSEPEFYHPEKWRGAPKDKKQGSDGEVDLGRNWYCVALDRETEPSVANSLDCLRFYNQLLDEGVAPEQARMVLPLNTYTEWYWSGTLKAWMKMYNLRVKPDAQLETQEIANQAGEILKEHFPVSFEALKR